MGAPVGNDNRAKQYRIKRTLEAILDRKSLSEGVDALEVACENLIDKAATDLASFKELADRLDGKPSQAVDLGSDPDRPLINKIVREIVRAPNQDG